jgi:hypothetical protein
VTILRVEDRKRAGAAAILLKNLYKLTTPQGVAHCKAVGLIKASARVNPSDSP